MSQVAINVYNLGDSTHKVNNALKLIGTGVFHVAVEIDGAEWSFGLCRSGTGVFRCQPRHCHAHTFRRRFPIGETEKSTADVQKLLEKLRKEWQGPEYDILRRNCCHFSDAFLRELGLGGLPVRIRSLADMGIGLGRFKDALGMLKAIVGVEPTIIEAPLVPRGSEPRVFGTGG